MGIHKRFTACEADELCAQPAGFLQEGDDVRAGEVDQAVVARAGLYVAIGTFYVAQGACVEPQGVQVCRDHPGSCFAVGGGGGIGEFCQAHSS